VATQRVVILENMGVTYGLNAFRQTACLFYARDKGSEFDAPEAMMAHI
jgi:hypothetical protein